MKLASIILLLTITGKLTAQSPAIKALEQTVYQFNNRFKYDSSLVYIYGLLNHATISNDERYYAHLYLSYTYKRLYDYNTAIKHLDSAYQYSTKTTQPQYYAAIIRGEKSFALFDIHKYHEADSLMRLLEASGYKYLGNEDRATVYMQQAYLRYLQKSYASAEARYNEALEIMATSNPCNLPIIYGKKIELYGATRNMRLMQQAYETGLAKSDSCNILKYKMYLNEMMVKTFEQQKDYRQAYYYYKKLNDANKIYDEKAYLLKLSELETTYENQRKQQRIDSQQLTIQDKNRSIYFLISLLIVILLLSLLAYQLLQRKRLQNDKKQFLNYTKQLLLKMEEDRKRIAAELHDSISHDLVHLKLVLHEDITSLQGKIDGIINNIRIIVRNLHPILFERIGFKKHLENLVAKMQQHHNFLITTDIQYTGGLDTNTELQLYRIVQESITNMVKHAEAYAGKISIIEDGKCYYVDIKDNGKGFKVQECLLDQHAFGLHNIIDRAIAIGGTAAINSSPKGTHIQITLPKN